MDSNINLNQAECIKEIANFGHTVYKNICTGTMSTVPWGSMDWLGSVAISIFGLVLLVCVVGLGIAIVKLVID